MRLNFLTRMYNESLVLLVNNGSKTPNVLKATNNLSMFTVVPEGFEFRFADVQTHNILDSLLM
jgi:hypothetical protein